jgi:hypothetical protein
MQEEGPRFSEWCSDRCQITRIVMLRQYWQGMADVQTNKQKMNTGFIVRQSTVGVVLGELHNALAFRLLTRCKVCSLLRRWKQSFSMQCKKLNLKGMM